MTKTYYVYILTNHQRTLYIGVTNNLERRMYEHKNHLVEGFTKQYKLDQLVYYDQTNDVREAITEEKRLKGLFRAKKIAIIEAFNPNWSDMTPRLDPSFHSG